MSYIYIYMGSLCNLGGIPSLSHAGLSVFFGFAVSRASQPCLSEPMPNETPAKEPVDTDGPQNKCIMNRSD